MTARLSSLVAGGLVGVLLLSVVAIALLAGLELPVPGVLENLAAGSLGALGALLARVGSDEPERVVVTNTAAEAVPVDAAPELAD